MGSSRARPQARSGRASPARGSWLKRPPGGEKRAATQAGGSAAFNFGDVSIGSAARLGVSGPAQPLPHRDRIQASFGRHDVSGIVAHTGDKAAAAARSIGAEAFTMGSDVAFSGEPDVSLAAHEAAHAIQQRGGSAPRGGVGERGDPEERSADQVAARVSRGQSSEDLLSAYAGARAPSVGVQRFASGEHEQIGNAGSGGVHTDIMVQIVSDGKMVPRFLTYGEMVALSGDYFGSLDEIRKLSNTDQLSWARWKALGNGPEPPVSQDVKDKVMNRYFTLAANNFSHFSAGGTASQDYEGAHLVALQKAFNAGQQNDLAVWDTAVAAEAFSNHFLTDMFSAGHVRTERQAIKSWYKSNFPNSIDLFVADMAGFIYDRLPGLKKVFTSKSDIASQIKGLGGPALASFTLGDIVSLAFHNKDNLGLDVVSEKDETGASNVSWHAMGDDHLASSTKTFDMATAAVKASFGELTKMRDMAKGITVGDLDQIEGDFLKKMLPFAALKLIPHVDTSSKTNADMNWHWGSFTKDMRAAVDAAISAEIVPVLRSKAAGLSDDDAKKALLDYCTQLDSKGTSAIETAIGATAGP